MATMPVLSFARTAASPTPSILQVPETLEDAQHEAGQLGKKVWQKLPSILKDIWEDEVIPVWKQLWNWIMKAWDHTVKAWAQSLWNWIMGLFDKEINKRKDLVQEQIEEERKELQDEIAKEGENITRSLWQRLRDLFRDADTP